MTHSLLSSLVSNGLAALLLATVVWLITRKIKSPPLAHALWLLVLVKLISPPLFDVPLPSLREIEEPPATVNLTQNNFVEASLPSMQSEAETLHEGGRESIAELPVYLDGTLAKSTPDPVEFADEFEPVLTAEANINEPIVPHRSALSEILCVVWAAGVAIWLAVAAIRILRFRKLLARTRPANAGLQQEVAQLAADFGLRSLPQVRIAAGVMPPLTWALWGRPVVLLPSKLLDELTDAERHTLLAHELAHLKRRDHLVRWLEIAAVGLNWWQPVAWFTQMQLHRASEECCDAWVIRRFPQLTRAYAEALLKTVDFLAAAQPSLPIGSTGFGQAHQLKRRFEMILHERKNDRMTWLVRLMVAAVACVVLPLSVKSLWAEPPKPGIQPGDLIDVAKLRENQRVASERLNAEFTGQHVISDTIARHPGVIVAEAPKKVDDQKDWC